MIRILFIILFLAYGMKELISFYMPGMNKKTTITGERAIPDDDGEEKESWNPNVFLLHKIAYTINPFVFKLNRKKTFRSTISWKNIFLPVLTPPPQTIR